MAEDKKLTELILLDKSNPDDLMYIVTYIEGVATSRAISVAGLLQSTITGVNRIISGQVIWTGVGYVFISVNLVYELNGQIYLSDGEEVTLDDPDAQDRFDNLFVDLNGLDIKKGTPSGSPAVPSLDNPDSEISTNIVLVQNGQSTPSEITLAAIYSENLQESGGEYDTFESSSGLRIDLANTALPINLTKDVKAISPNALDFLNFNHSVATQIEDFQNIRMKIKSLGNWKRDYIRFEFYDGVFLAGYAFINSNSFDTRDTTTIVDLFITYGDVFWTTDFVEFDAVRYFWYDGGGGSPISAARFQVDLIKLETGGTSTKPKPSLTMDSMANMTNSKTTPISADNFTLWNSVDGQFQQLSLANLKTYFDGFYGSGVGDMLLAGVQIVTGAKTFNDTKLLMRNVADSFSSRFTNVNTANRTYTLQNKTGIIAHLDDVTGGGDVSGPASAVNENIAVFDSTTGKLIKDGLINKQAIIDNTAKVTNVSTNLSEGTSTETTVDVDSSDGTNATLVAASTSRAGVMTKAKFDEVVVNTAKTSFTNLTGEVTSVGAAATIASDVVDRDNLADDLKKVLTNATTGATETLDWNAYSGFILTMDEACTFSDSNLPVSPDEDQITILMTGDFAATLPTYWKVGGDTYDGTVWNLLAVECKDNTGAAEQVVCIITNLTT